uniref:Complement factor b, like n=1 Tax=Periophthalmus magnuspinnatus TaxID=409849 RepID=A0A3B3ZMI2_9GOBI
SLQTVVLCPGSRLAAHCSTITSLLCLGDVVWCNCSMNGMEIEGANFSLSNGLNEGSILQYQCPTGYYAYPELAYRCQLNHRWTPEPQSRLRCRRVECPDPTVLQNGYTLPINENKRYYYESKITYHCYTGYTLHGPFRRKCLENGKWSGSNPVCRQDSGDCADPGVPPGGMRFGNSFEIGDKVNFKCRSNMILIGSEQRECQVDGQWSGTETSCYYKYTYDSPWEVTGEFGRGIRNTLTSEFVDGTQKGLSITLSRNGTLNIFIALDVSESIDDDSFQSAKDAIKTLIKKVNKSWTYKTDRFGTNLNAVFERILEKMAAIKIRDSRFSEHKHVIILFTDGNFFNNNFIKRNITFKPVYLINNVITVFLPHADESDVRGLCGLYQDYGEMVEDENRKKYPWFISLTNDGRPSHCLGSLVSPRFILTAAHCFKDKSSNVTVEGTEVQAIHIHPNFNISAKVNQGVKEFYDYDVTLIELVEDAPITISLRPICIPCTVETNTALRQNLTCKEQGKPSLLPCFSHLMLLYWRISTLDTVCDSGGAVFKNYESRTFQVSLSPSVDRLQLHYTCMLTFLSQVALVSWGSKQMRNCKNNRPVHSDDESRDFHINLFKVVPFLKSILGNTEKYFVPLLFVD